MAVSINPHTAEILEEYPEHSVQQIEEVLIEADAAFQVFRKSSFEDRSVRLDKLAELLLIQKGELAELMTQEMGKPVTQAAAEVEKCAWVCRFYAEKAGSFLSERVIATDAFKSYVKYEPLGVILAIMPWNFPLWQVFRFAAPTIMAGNTAILKHASNVTGCSLAIERLFKEAGFQRGVFTSVILPGNRVEQIIRDPRCKGVSLTGSEAAGSSVASLAGKYIKPSLLELGGSNPFIVLEDADMTAALNLAVTARIQNNGQSCIAAKRFLVHESREAEFVDGLKSAFESLVTGDPMQENCQIGPLARFDLAEELEDQLNRSLVVGGQLVCGGKRDGAFFEPTIVSGVRPGMSVWDEETFGPLAAVATFSSLDEMLELAKHRTYGLGVSVCTADPIAAEKLVSEFEEGAVFINELVKSDPRLPFGGVKSSGYGRELSEEGIKAFVNAKTVFINS